MLVIDIEIFDGDDDDVYIYCSRRKGRVYGWYLKYILLNYE